MRSPQQLEARLNLSGQAPRVQRPAFLDNPPRDTVKSPFPNERPTHEVQSRLRDRDPQRPQDARTSFDREILEDRRDRALPRVRHPLDDPGRNKSPKLKKRKPIEIDFEEPLPIDDLIEIVPGVYRTPDDPVDPRNCNLWPDSPWCGGMPWTRTPVGLEPKIVADSCTIGVRVQPIFGFTNMPPIEIQYRRPGRCREKPPPPDFPEDPDSPPIQFPRGNPNAYVALFANIDSQKVETNYYSDGYILKTKISNKVGFDSFLAEGKTIGGFSGTFTFKSKTNYQVLEYKNPRPTYYGHPVHPPLFDNSRSKTFLNIALPERGKAYVDLQVSGTHNIGFPSDAWRVLDPNSTTLNSPFYIQGVYKDLIRLLQWEQNQGNWVEIVEREDWAGGGAIVTVYQRKISIAGVIGLTPLELDETQLPPPYPPQKKPDCRCMRCCGNESSNNNLDDLKALINKLDKKIGEGNFKITIPDANPLEKGNQSLTLEFKDITDALAEIIGTGRYGRIDNARLEGKLGLENFPAKAPAWLNDLDQEDIEINSMPEYLAYIVRQMDAVLGQFPIKIKIKDSDLTQEGNQEVTLNIPNLAEGIAELLGLALTTRTDVDATLNAVIRNLVETGSTRQQVFLAYQLAMANAEFLGYKLEHKKIKVPFAFTPGKSKLDEILKESEQTIVGFENQDTQDLKDIIAPLLELAAMWKAQNFRRVSPINTAADILSILKNGKDLYDSLLKKEGGEEENNESWSNSWDEFQRQVEQGWTQTPGVSDNVNPYGRNFSERPRIRELGDTSDGDTNAN